jgi:hypothetical protein
MPAGIRRGYYAELSAIRSGLLKGEMLVYQLDVKQSFTELVVTLIVREVSPTQSMPTQAETRAIDLIDRCLHNRGVYVRNFQQIQSLPYTITNLGGNTPKLPQPPMQIEYEIEFLDVTVAVKTFTAAATSMSAATQRMMNAMNQFVPSSLIIEDGGDSTELIVGYRDFNLCEGDWNLASRNGALWPSREKLVALCKNDVFAPHDPPFEGCACGIYAYDSPTDTNLRKSANIWGEVYLWGKVFICECGYRAEYAYPKTIFVRDRGTKAVRHLAKELENLYGVPVILAAERDGRASAEIFADMVTKELGGGETNNDDS